MSAQFRVWRPRRPAYYPLLLSGLGILEYLSAEDCGLIAAALDVSLNPAEGEEAHQERLRELAEHFKEGARR